MKSPSKKQKKLKRAFSKVHVFPGELCSQGTYQKLRPVTNHNIHWRMANCDAACIVCQAGSMQWSGVHPSVCLSPSINSNSAANGGQRVCC